MGRKSTFDNDLAISIIERMSNGEAVSKICAPDDMPAPSTVRLWAIRDEGGWFAESYARARELQGECEADEISQVIHDIRDGKIDAQMGRVIMDGHKWRAAHLAVRTWGDKLQTEISGKDGGPVQFVIRDVDKE